MKHKTLSISLGVAAALMGTYCFLKKTGFFKDDYSAYDEFEANQADD
ncbi:methanol dehydrogenase [Agrilactobacillus composti]|nr:methanol dehydrogenase [Agrilactobacillus composti]